MKKVAVVLCGSGFKDGSEIRESVAALWALDEAGARFQCFAPELPQRDVVNCLTKEVEPDATRNMRVEAARIARGDVKALNELHMQDWDAVVIPGGFGVAKNLCTFAFEGIRGSVLPDMARVLNEARSLGKPMGAICIAPAMLALAFRETPLELTLGGANDAARAIQELGHRHRVCAPSEICVDRTHKVVSTPAYMHDDAPLREIFAGIRKLVKETLALTA